MSTHTSKWFKNNKKQTFYSAGGITVKSIWVKINGKRYGSDEIVVAHKIRSSWGCPKNRVKVGIETRYYSNRDTKYKYWAYFRSLIVINSEYVMMFDLNEGKGDSEKYYCFGVNFN